MKSPSRESPDNNEPAIEQAPQPKAELQGRIKKLELFGALVELADGREGLLHLSQLERSAPGRSGPPPKVGDAVTVWVSKVNAVGGAIFLTLDKPVEVEWRDLAEGQVRRGKVVRVEQFGVFLDIGAEKPGLIHVRELTADRVEHANEVVKEGAELEAKVIGVDRRRRRLDLSVRALEAEMIEAVATEELPAVTAMGMLLSAAMANAEAGARGGKRERRAKKGVDAAREDLLQRTLAKHRT